MLALIQDNQIEKYPLDSQYLREKFPQTSFAIPLNAADLADYGVVEVETLPMPEFDASAQRVVSKDPEFVDGKWVVGYDLVNRTQEEIDSDTNQLVVQEKSRRNALLSQSDWTQLPDNNLSDEEKESWKVYRQQLRDITEQSGFPHNISWPSR